MQDGLSAPPRRRTVAQRRLLKAVPSESDYDGAVESLEMHGTGTALGDPIEVGAAANTLCGKAKNPARATSLKAIMGHLESGARGRGRRLPRGDVLVRKPMPPNPLLKRLNGHLGSFLKQHPFAPPVEPRRDGGRRPGRAARPLGSGTIAHARFSPAMDDADDRLYGAAPAPRVAASGRALRGELMDRFAKALGNTELPPTLLFDYPTVNALQKFLGEGAVVKDRKIVAKVDKGGRGNGLRHLAACHGNGGNAVQFLPLHRRDEAWSVVKDYPGAATYGGFLSVDDVEYFAMDDFALTKAESKGMDPQQRLALEVGARALRDEGGYSLEAMVDADAGSYVGAQTSDFYDLARRPDSGVGPTYLATGANHAVASGRLPYVLGLRRVRPWTTACSTAPCCHLARGGLDLSSTSEAALVVAVNLNLLAAMTVGVAKAGMLSTKGQCHTLDELADGYVRSEGCAGLLLIDEKKASPVDARLAASAVRSDGVSASLTAPSGLAQQELLREALSDARSKNPGHVELHGTGTALGDPIEIGALAALKSAEHPTTTAVKANAKLHLLNSRLGHFATKFFGATDATPEPSFEASLVKQGGVSSFGFSGSIAHTRLSGAEDLSDEDVRALVPVAETLPPYPTKYRFELVCSTKPTCCGQVHVPADAAAEPEPEKPIKTYEVVWGRESLATPPEDTRDAWDYGNDKVLIVGGGLTACSAAALDAGATSTSSSRARGFLGGVWVTMANLTSKVQTGKLTYTLDLEDQSPHVADESNFQPADEVVKSITGFALRMGIDKKTSIFREVTSVTYEPWPSKDCGGVIFACGSLRSPTLAPMAPAHYGGYDSYGVCGDMRPCEMAGRDLVIAGHGAYGVENVRTGLEHGAKAITLASGLTKVRADVALLCYASSKETSIVNRTMGVFEEGDLTGIWAVQPQLTKIIRRVQHVSVNDVCAWTDFVEDCAGDWRKYAGAVGVPRREEPYGDWLGRSPSPHPDGLGQRKEASRALTADGPLASPAAHHVSVLVFDDAAAKVGADAWTAVSTPGRTPGVLVLAFPATCSTSPSARSTRRRRSCVVVEEPRLKLRAPCCAAAAAPRSSRLCEAPAAKDCVLTSNSGVLVPPLVETASPTADERSELRGAWAVTGGTGALGLVSAALLMDLQGDVVIATRSPRIKVFDKDALVAPPPPKRAHLVAGVDTKVERWMVDKVTGPKASNLGFLRGLVDDVVHFTSATVILGGPGQTAYAHSSGASATTLQRGGGRRSSALQWLAIEGVGMHQEAVGTAPQWTPLERMERILGRPSAATSARR
ncbi:hypothetical protein JL720_15607 [Aureococcus anophagefferens]|nr:hypothetical protein JL720_15607 [Aureococcus anophagefferens]